MSLSDVTLGWRIVAALAFLGVVSAVDLARNGARATRWRGSLFLIAAGAAGAGFGVAVDLVTSSISEAYFAVGKGLGRGPELLARILALGVRAGLSAGVLIGCVYLAANHVRSADSPGPTRALFRLLVHPLAGAVVVGALLGALAATILPLELAGSWRTELTPDEVRPFLTVWSIHGGLYLGGAAGAAVGVRSIRRHGRAAR